MNLNPYTCRDKSAWRTREKRRLAKKPNRIDSFDVEAMEIAGTRAHHSKDLSLWPTIALAFKTLGVVYGDIGTSPLYVFVDVFSKVPIGSNDDILGALSLEERLHYTR
ncbi:hypothetical protein JHK87_049945 [Glycine soja]|nr:hypothetical protein JHK87_049945 [Glycine soja]